jgi:hypothetical protein
LNPARSANRWWSSEELGGQFEDNAAVSLPDPALVKKLG